MVLKEKRLKARFFRLTRSLSMDVSGGTGHRQELQHLITSRHYHAYCGKNASAQLQEDNERAENR
jgi:hypothetical protein